MLSSDTSDKLCPHKAFRFHTPNQVTEPISQHLETNEPLGIARGFFFCLVFLAERSKLSIKLGHVIPEGDFHRGTPGVKRSVLSINSAAPYASTRAELHRRPRE